MAIKSTLTLKTWKKYFDLVWQGQKTFEVRKLDNQVSSNEPEKNDLKVGDFITLVETEDGTTGETSIFTGRKLICVVSYILSHKEFPDALKEGWYIISLFIIEKNR